MNFSVKFTGEVELVYSIIDDPVIAPWKAQILSRKIADLCPINHYSGSSRPEDFQTKLDRLYWLCDKINERVPQKITKLDVDTCNWRETLSVMHIHFPDLEKEEEYKDIWGCLSEYNDTIHYLENMLQGSDDFNSFRITLDFNKSGVEFIEIPEESYRLFTSNIAFGDLLLHYTHVGKNAFEILVNQDFNCPKDQFRPQRTFCSSVRMHFMDDFKIPDELWKRFYNLRGGYDFWGMDPDDPKMALGFMKIGGLVSIKISGNDYPIPTDKNGRDIFREILIANSVTGWHFI